jgi:hypothetical protein
MSTASICHARVQSVPSRREGPPPLTLRVGNAVDSYDRRYPASTDAIRVGSVGPSDFHVREAYRLSTLQSGDPVNGKDRGAWSYLRRPFAEVRGCSNAGRCAPRAGIGPRRAIRLLRAHVLTWRQFRRCETTGTRLATRSVRTTSWRYRAATAPSRDGRTGLVDIDR